MRKAEEYVIKSIVRGFCDNAEYVSKEDALKAVEIEHEEMAKNFSAQFQHGCLTDMGLEIGAEGGFRLNIEIQEKQ